MNGYVQRLCISICTILFLTNGSVSFAQDTGNEFIDPNTEAGQATQEKTTESRYKADEIIITATKSAINPKETGAAVTIITKEEIEKSGKKTVTDLLDRVSAVTISRNAGFGGVSSVSMRGADNKDLLVLIDGVEVNDVSGPNSDFDFAHLTPAGIERIEIIRGPASVLYGSNASAGVINIITKKGIGKPVREISVEGGSYCTTTETLSVAGSEDYINYASTLSNTYSKGYSKARKPEGSTEEFDKDPYRNTTSRTRLGIDVSDSTSIMLFMNFTGADTDIDYGSFQDSDEYNETTYNTSVKGCIDHSMNKYWSIILNASQAQTTRSYDTSLHDGEKNKVDLLQEININNWNIISVGVETEKESMHSTYLDKKSTRNNAVYGQNHLKIHDIFYFIAGIRLDDHESFGKDVNYSLSTSIILPLVGTRLKGNYSTSFKAPSLYQLYDASSGDENLEPEESYSYDFGLEQYLFNKQLRLEANAFYSKYKNTIEYNDSTYEYYNGGRLEIKGCEVLADLYLFECFKLYGGYSYTKTENLETGEEALKRPRHKVQAGFDLDFMDQKGNINSSFAYHSSRKDSYYDPWPTKKIVTLKSYYTIDVAASYWITEVFQVFGRVENIMDKDYSESYGYNTTGRFISLGLRSKF